MPSIFPKQKIPTSQKTPQWYTENTDFLIDQASFYSGDRRDMIECYKAALGEIDEHSYKYVLNPFNTGDANLLNFPARLRNLDVIIPILNLYLGEKANKTFNHRTIVSNPDVVNKFKETRDQEFLKVMSQHFVNELNAAGVETGVESQPVPAYEKILANSQVGDSDKRAIYSQEALDYIKHQLSLKDKYLELMYDWLVVGRVYTFKDIYKNNILHEVVPPLEIWHGTTKTGFIEDADWVLRETRFNLNEVIDRFHEAFARKQYYIKDGDNKKTDPITLLEDRYKNKDSSVSSIASESAIALKNETDTDWDAYDVITSRRSQIIVVHTQWKGFIKVGILSYLDELGQPQEMEVDEKYKLNIEGGDIALIWEWRSCVHEQYRIDEDIYVYGRYLQVPREDISNTSLVKLSYNGRSGYTERNKVNSIVKQILPYQVLINIYNYRLEMIIAKNKEKIMTLPLGLIPNRDGWDEDKTFHFAEATGLLMVDETAPNAVAALNALKSIDMSLGKYISEMKDLIRSTKEDAWDAIGMNRQRYGDVNSSDGKSVNEQAAFRSAVISREMNRRLEKFEESDIQGLIEYSKVAWIDGKRGAYINSEGRSAYLELDGPTWLDIDCGIFVVDSAEETEKLRKAQDYAFGFAQNSKEVPPSVVMEILDSNNMSKLKAIINKSEAIQKQYEQAAAENAQKAEAELADKQMATVQAQLENKLQVEQIKGEFAVQVALIGQSGEAQAEVPQEELENEYDDYINKKKAQDLDKQKEGLGAANKIANTRLQEAKFAQDERKMESAEKIARMNKN